MFRIIKRVWLSKKALLPTNNWIPTLALECTLLCSSCHLEVTELRIYPYPDAKRMR